MDFRLAALKLMSEQLSEAIPSPSPPSSYTLGDGLLFQRAWLQGVIVQIINPDDNINNDNEKDDKKSLPRFLLDDGTGIVELHFMKPDLYHSIQWHIGMYLMVVGSCIVRPDEIPVIKIHKIVDLSAFPDREAMWYLEVIEAYRMFYQQVFEDSPNMEES